MEDAVPWIEFLFSWIFEVELITASVPLIHYVMLRPMKCT